MKKLFLILIVLLLSSCTINNPSKDVEKNCEHDYICTTTKSPSCTEIGINEFCCSKCKNTYTEEINKLEHNYIDGICINCGKSKEKTYLNELFGSDITYLY